MLAFVAAVVLISASPGPAMALILRRAALHGMRGAVPTVLGLELGLYTWALLAAGGFAALVAASEIAYLVLRVVGAAVLILLGVRAWRSVLDDRRQPATPPAEHAVAAAQPSPDAPGARVRRGWWTAFGEGVLVQLANPKAAVFMIAFYPQFVPAGQPLFTTTAALALVQVAIEILLYLALAAGVARAGTWTKRPRIRRRLDAISGTVLIALGIRLAAAP